MRKKISASWRHIGFQPMSLNHALRSYNPSKYISLYKLQNCLSWCELGSVGTIITLPICEIWLIEWRFKGALNFDIFVFWITLINSTTKYSNMPLRPIDIIRSCVSPGKISTVDRWAAIKPAVNPWKMEQEEIQINPNCNCLKHPSVCRIAPPFSLNICFNVE